MHPILEDLQEKQYADLYHLDDAPIADLRRKALSRMGWWAVALAVAGALAGLVVTFPDMIGVSFVLKSEVSEEIYRFPATVYVEGMHVQNGQQITAGTPLLTLSAPEVAALVNEYTSARDKLRQFEGYKTTSSQQEQEILRLNIRKIGEDISLKRSRLAALHRQGASESEKLDYDVRETRRIFEANQALFRTGDLSRNELNKLEAGALKAKHAYQSAHQQYQTEKSALEKNSAAQQLEISSLEKQIYRTRNELSLEYEQLESTLRAISQRIEGTYGTSQVTDSHQLRLLARRSGTVSFVFEGEKEAQPGSILVKIMHTDAPLYAYTQVNSSQIGKVAAGQPVVLKLDAYPVYEWGSGQGRVGSISLTPDEKGLFNVRIRVVNPRKLKGLVRMGMQGQGNIILADRSLYGYVFREFAKVASEVSD
ncbi:MAG: HlyD family efflux transporter periplasmic adaptor subunit [Cytophagales bacterium]|nr:HlyD family efflux transporter periplasmic adaptor subunit [Cytophagales bacterium]